MKPLDLFREGKIDELCENIGPLTPVQDMEDLYMSAEWTEELLSRITSLRIDNDDAENVDVPMIIGVSSKMGFVDIIRILVYRSGFEPEGKYTNFDTKYTLSALEIAVVHGMIDSIDLLVQCGTRNRWGEASNMTVFEFAYMSRQLESMRRLVFWAERLTSGICGGDSWVRVNFRMLMGMERDVLRIFSESSDSGIHRNTEKEIRLYIFQYLQNGIFKK